MEILLTIIHWVACIMLIVIVLLQKGKGADLAGAFGGGGSQSNVGVRTRTQIVHKMTIAAAVFFMITSYSLGLIQGAGRSYAEWLEAQQQATQEQETEERSEPQEDDNREPADAEPESTPETDGTGTTTGGTAADENEGISAAPEEDKKNPDGNNESN